MTSAFAFFGRIGFEGRWSSRHHLAARISRRRPVVYLEDPAGFFRERRPEGPDDVVSIRPLDWPLQRFGFLKRAGDRAAARAIRGALPRGTDRLTAVLYVGAPLDVVHEVHPDRIVYHAIDDYSETYDGERDHRLLEWEQEAMEIADVVVAITEPIRERLRNTGHPRVELLPLGYDERRFTPGSRAAPPDLSGLPRPLLGFAGTINAERLDLPLLIAVASARPDCGFVLVGGAVGTLPKTLTDLPNVRVLGFRPRERIPDYVAAFDVAIAPYRDCRINRSCFPLKVVEALAMGVPAVYAPVRDDLVELAPHVKYGSDAESFLASVDAALETGARAEARRTSVRDLGWDRLSEQFEAIGANPISGV